MAALRLSLYLAVALLALGVGTTPLAAQTLNWATKAPMRIPRMDLGAAVANNRIYAVGGFSGSTLSVIEEYDPTTNVWTRKADMPTPRRLLVVAAVNGKVYAIGGANFSNDQCTATYTRATEQYDPATDIWTKKADIPLDPAFNGCVGNQFIGGAAANGRIYVAAFNTNTQGLTATYEYDPARDTWDPTKAPVPFSYTQFAAATLNGIVYVIASDAPNFWNENFAIGAGMAEYDPAINIWIIREPTVSPRRLMTSAAVGGGKLYAVGGQAFAGVVDGLATFHSVATVEAFDPSTNRWAAGTPMPTPRHSAAAAALNGKIYVIGGSSSVTVGSSTYGSVPLATLEEGTPAASPPHARRRAVRH